MTEAVGSNDPTGDRIEEARLALERKWTLIALTGKWFTFWGVGMRLGIAGVRQAFNPGFTARDVFEIGDERVHPIVRELGFANLSLGLLGLLALIPGWATPGALAGGLFFALAGWKHVAAKERNASRTVAMVRSCRARGGGGVRLGTAAISAFV